jgi:Arc/MetJ family transcription regulator
MSRTNIDIDDELIADVMGRLGFKTKREAVEYALRVIRNEAYTPEQIMALAGTNFWDGDPVAAGLDPVEFPDLFDGSKRTA